MKRIQIERTSAERDASDIQPDFIFNRFDLWEKPGMFDVVCVQYLGKKYVLEVQYNGHEAFMGLWLMDIPQLVIKAVAKKIFLWHDEIKKIYYVHGLQKAGATKKGHHYYVKLPASTGELEKKSSKKSRYNLRRSIRMLEEKEGDINFYEYKADNGIPLLIMKEYLLLKNETFNAYENEYIEHLSEEDVHEYIASKNITNMYVMKVNGIMAGAILSCEKCACVFMENITYNLRYEKFSPGIIIYDHYLKCMVEKSKQAVFLGGGDWEYKKRYSAVEDVVYEGRFYRSRLHMMLANLKVKLAI